MHSGLGEHQGSFSHNRARETFPKSRLLSNYLSCLFYFKRATEIRSDAEKNVHLNIFYRLFIRAYVIFMCVCKFMYIMYNV